MTDGVLAENLPELIKSLRVITGRGVLDCRRALLRTRGNLEAAVESLRKEGAPLNLQRLPTGNGIVASYIEPGGRRGAIVELLCDTDYAARTDEMKSTASWVAFKLCLRQATQDDPEIVARVTEASKALGEPVKIGRAEVLGLDDP
jgi:elongation factor Ts